MKPVRKALIEYEKRGWLSRTFKSAVIEIDHVRCSYQHAHDPVTLVPVYVDRRKTPHNNITWGQFQAAKQEAESAGKDTMDLRPATLRDLSL